MLISEIIDPAILKDMIPKETGKFITDEKKMLAWLKKSGLTVHLPTFTDGKCSANYVSGRDISWSHFPIEWNEIETVFIIADSNLRTLIGGPKRVGSNFNISNNQIYSLEGSPNYVGGFVSAIQNRISSLDGCPKEIHGYFDIARNRLESLEHGPALIKGGYFCGYNKLKSLKGLPSRINGNFSCNNNIIDSIADLPTHVDGFIDISNNKLTSLAGIDKIVKYVNEINISDNPITSSILGLMKIDGLAKIIADRTISSKELSSAVKIINEHLGKGKQGILAAQQELIDADLEDFAEF